LLVKISSNDAKEAQVQTALNIGNWTSIALVAVSCFVLSSGCLPAEMQMSFFGEGVQRQFRQ
jgi:K(+)-stimulated pyrophosphate-energized sodium pump